MFIAGGTLVNVESPAIAWSPGADVGAGAVSDTDTGGVHGTERAVASVADRPNVAGVVFNALGVFGFGVRCLVARLGFAAGLLVRFAAGIAENCSLIGNTEDDDASSVDELAVGDITEEKDVTLVEEVAVTEDEKATDFEELASGEVTEVEGITSEEVSAIGDSVDTSGRERTDLCGDEVHCRACN